VLKAEAVKDPVVVKPARRSRAASPVRANSIPAGAGRPRPCSAKSVDSFSGGALSLRATTATVQAFRFRIANTGERAHNRSVAGNCATVGLVPQGSTPG
jgi:hypothetical protein